MDKLDPVTLAVVRDRLVSTVKQMASLVDNQIDAVHQQEPVAVRCGVPKEQAVKNKPGPQRKF